MNSTTQADQPSLNRVLDFLQSLDQAKLHYTLDSVRHEALMVTVVVPGQHWEVEFMSDGSVQVERFVSDGTIDDETSLAELFRDFGA
jgi:hypothetical protein